MTTPQETEIETQRRLSQVRHDVDDVYNLLTRVESVQKKHGTQLAGQGARLDVLGRDVAAMRNDVSELRLDLNAVRNDVAVIADSLTEVLRRLPRQD